MIGHRHNIEPWETFYYARHERFVVKWTCGCGDTGEFWTKNYLEAQLTKEQAIWALKHQGRNIEPKTNL